MLVRNWAMSEDDGLLGTFCPRYLVNSLITQNNAWDKSYNRAKGEISNKK